MKTMKVIDLFNKIANGELGDIMFRNGDKYFKYWKNTKTIDRYTNDSFNTVECYNDMSFNSYNLNDEVEIIEDKSSKIEQIDMVDNFSGLFGKTSLTKQLELNFQQVNEKFNELIDKVNYLLEKSDSNGR